MPKTTHASTPGASEIQRMPPLGTEKAVVESDDLFAGRISDAQLAERIGKLPRDVGWMLFGVGLFGVVAPGIIGFPFMVAGGLILWPKTTRRLNGLLGDKAPQKPVAAGMKQLARFLDDLDRRYPRGSPALKRDIQRSK
ncbi:MAG: hypothetical protein ACOYMG_02705 [Candidatus Methylumidiphilus sp.]